MLIISRIISLRAIVKIRSVTEMVSAPPLIKGNKTIKTIADDDNIKKKTVFTILNDVLLSLLSSFVQ